MKCFLYIVFFSFPLLLESQVVGYMGKRLTIGYSSSFSPNLISAQFDVRVDRTVLTQAANIGYVISSKRELCASVKYNTRKIFYSRYITNSSLSLFESVENLSSFEYSIGLRRFDRSKFAPLGAYSKWEGVFIRSRMNYSPYESENFDTSVGAPYTIHHEGGTIKFKSLAVAFTRGRQRIFLDKFVVDFGAKAMLMVVYDNSNSGYVAHETFLASGVNSTLSFSPIANVFIGLGFLAL